jgi:signal transduction histidine kinase
MRLTVGGRAVAAALIAAVTGWLYIDIGWRLVTALLLNWRGSGNRAVICGGSGLGRAIGIYNGCNSFNYHYGYAAAELLIGTAVAAAIFVGLARWVTAPLRQVTDSIAALGPTNLGLRLNHRGARHDRTRQLADAIDGMLDRVSDGYEAQRRFASTASHELRTPLATQRALIEVSLGSALTAEQLDLVARQLLATNQRNEQLIDGLLTLAETERGLATTSSVRLDALVDDVISTHQDDAHARGVTVHADLGPTTVRGEAALLERLSANLVQNAIKYNRAGGTVAVTVRPGQLAVTNTGPLVPAQAVAGLFEPFRRLSGERLDHGGGVGLGLTIARSIVAAHHGTITAQANPDGGLRVDVRLPA